LIPAGDDQKGKPRNGTGYDYRDDSAAALDRGTAATAGSGALRDLSARGQTQAGSALFNNNNSNRAPTVPARGPSQGLAVVEEDAGENF